jgi:phenylalanyl-tRNA synthetase beta chain
MKISYNWLKDYLDISMEAEQVASMLTNIGLETEAITDFEEVRGGMKGIVIGEVLSCAKHPNADKLSLTTVSLGDGNELKIVCGAPNVASGQKVVVATIGTTLYKGKESFTIKKTQIRGEESEGMLCAEDEIGLGNDHNGIMVLDNAVRPGTPAAEYFNITTDTVFEIGLTPNRIDAASHYGTARDLAAYLAQTGDPVLKRPDISSFSVDHTTRTIPITIEDTAGCRRFTGVTVSDLKVEPSPVWLQKKIKAIGLTPINNVVDITNFVLHELGQPLHAYDADKVNGGKIIVKRLPDGTPFITLDGEERKLSSEDVMVCDATNPVCIAGVFGGLHSGVTENTTSIFLESAYFDPVAVRKTAKRHGLSTDSSFRFERGVDPASTLFALKRAAVLIRDIAGGKISSEVQDVYPSPVRAVELVVKYRNIDRLIGKILPRDTIRSILRSLDFEITGETGDTMDLIVPAYRVDVTREADVIEEILRIYGYNNVEVPQKLNASISYRNHPDNETLVNQVSDYLSHSGFTEIMCNSLTKSDYYRDLATYPPSTLVPILNPLSADLSVMRQTLLFGGLESISRNINHKHPNLRLYEYGRVYSLKGSDLKNFQNFSETPVFGLFLTGNREEQSWAQKDSPVSFFQLKGYFTNLLSGLGIATGQFEIDSLESKADIFEGGLEYLLKDVSVIRAGIINPTLCKNFDIEQEVLYAELNWEELLKLTGKELKFKDLPKFPGVRRDLSLLLDDQVAYSQIENLAFRSEGKLLKKVNLFDYYKGKNIPEGKKSYAVSFILQDFNKTLTDKEIDKIMSKISQSLKMELKAELR